MLEILKRCRTEAGRISRFIILLFVFLWLPLALSLASQAQAAPERPRNVIILFADGAAMTQFEFGAYTARKLRGQDYALFDHVIANGSLGLMSTFSNDAFVTDSAAAASAMSTGHKVNNGAIATSPQGKALTPLMLAAKRAGKRIGLVTTAPVYDATPAAFAVSAKSRKDHQQIVDGYLALQPDVLMGGGRDMFLPKGAAGSARKDTRDLARDFAESGYGVVQSRAELAKINPGEHIQREAGAGKLVPGKWLGLFALEDMAFEIDRDKQAEPSLAEMTKAAMSALEGQAGFVLLLENESTDTTAHQNDAASLMHDLWAFDAALRVVLEYKARHPDTLVIVTGDHETGGLSPTYVRRKHADGKMQDIKLDDARLANLGNIKGSLASFVNKTADLRDNAAGHNAFKRIAAEYFPGVSFTPADLAAVINKTPSEEQTSYLPHNTLAQIIGKNTGIYWGTSGHTPEPVIAAATGPGHHIFQGYYDNTDFAKKLHQLLDIMQ